MKIKIIIGAILLLLCIMIPIAYASVQHFRRVEMGIPIRIILTAIAMIPAFSATILKIWWSRKRGEDFELMNEWYRQEGV